MDSTYIALGAVVLSAITLAAQMLGKSLSIREHEEFRGNVKDSIRDLKADFQREADDLREQIRVIQGAVPTTREIEARLDKKN